MKQNLEFIEVCGLEDSLLRLNDADKEFFEDLILFFVFMCMCGCLRECISNTGLSFRSQKKISDPLKLKLQPVVGSLARATSILNF